MGIYPKKGKSGGVDPIARVVVNVTQARTAAPVVTELANSHSFSITPTYEAEGHYKLTLTTTQKIPSSRTWAVVSGGGVGGTAIGFLTAIFTGDVLNIYTHDDEGVAADSLLTKVAFMLEAYAS